MNLKDKSQLLVKALKRIAGHEYRSNRRNKNMIDIEEIETLKRIARITLDAVNES
jgi:hypothetical protein